MARAAEKREARRAKKHSKDANLEESDPNGLTDETQAGDQEQDSEPDADTEPGTEEN